MEYEWDERKRRANIAKHGVDFPLAEGFDWTTAQIERDSRHNYGESRFKGVGWVEKRLYVLVFTKRSAVVRIIGLRRANRREGVKYENAKTGPH